MRAGLAALVIAGAALVARPTLPREVEKTTSPILVAYSFDDDRVETGPDTFRVFENARGSVQVSDAFRSSGTQSVEIRDAAGDGDFPELQGYFPLRRDGILAVHFTLMTTDASEELNVALAGPRCFQLGKDGIALWLQSRDGYLVHVSDSIPKRILRLDPFVWYGLYVEYEVTAGKYDLWVTPEGADEPAVVLRAQPNAASQPGSAVDKFSFVGDVGEDRSNVTYYVDEVVIASSREAVPEPFVAPGRRRFFVDLFERYRGAPPRLECVPAAGPDDFGLADADLGALRERGELGALAAALAGEATTSDEAVVAGVVSWRNGCRALAAGDPASALGLFDESGLAGTPVVALSRALALVGLGRIEDAQAILDGLPADLRADPRYGLAVARIAARLGDLENARTWNEWTAATAGARGADPGATSALAARVARLAAEQRFYLAMLAGDAIGAFDLAVETATSDDVVRRRRWSELAGDAAFAAGRADEAKRWYEKARSGADGEIASRLLLKLADVAWKEGDAAGERRLREAIYGSLVSESR